MQLNRPKHPRVYVTAADADAKTKSITVTVYDTTPAELMEEFQKFLRKREKAGRRRTEPISA
jgi:hypothetical protein